MKLKFSALDYLIIFVILELLIHFIFSFERIINYPFNYLGIPIIIFGGYLSFVWTNFIFKKEKTTTSLYGKPQKLITKGVFKFTRNPIYLGMILVLFGFSVLLSSWVNFLFLVLFIVLVDNIIIPFEEEKLEKSFGKKYSNYKKNVRRWI